MQSPRKEPLIINTHKTSYKDSDSARNQAMTNATPNFNTNIKSHDLMTLGGKFRDSQYSGLENKEGGSNQKDFALGQIQKLLHETFLTNEERNYLSS